MKEAGPVCEGLWEEWAARKEGSKAMNSEEMTDLQERKHTVIVILRIA